MDNSIPALQRAIRILEHVEITVGGASAAQLATLRIPRTSLYRILRFLTASGLLAEQPGEAASYVLGPAIRRMAANMPVRDDLAARARSVMERLSAEIGETVKVVVREGLETVAVAIHHPNEDSRIASRLGARLPLHVGAGQRLLLSRAPAEVLDAVLAGPLPKHGIETIVNPVALRRNVSALRRQDWALGRNEGAAGVGSIAALIDEPGRPPRAALVALYILSGRDRSDALRMRDSVLRAARTI